MLDGSVGSPWPPQSSMLKLSRALGEKNKRRFLRKAVPRLFNIEFWGAGLKRSARNALCWPDVIFADTGPNDGAKTCECVTSFTRLHLQKSPPFSSTSELLFFRPLTFQPSVFSHRDRGRYERGHLDPVSFDTGCVSSFIC